MNFTPTVADCAQFYANVSTTPNNFGPVTVLQTGTAMGASGIYAPETVYQLSVTTSIYLNGYCWSVGSNTCQMAGTIVGRRRR
jgi:hypothetical protein